MGKMIAVVEKLATMDQPWNCPHGRPTMRHLVDMNKFAKKEEEKNSENDDEVSAKQSFEDAITEPGIDDCSDKEDKRKTTSSFRCECEDFEDNIVSDSDPTKSEENQESRTL